MNEVRATALGVLADLRGRRLLPVAAVLLVLVIAVPVVLSKPAEDVPPARPAPTSTAVNGLPSPEQALSNDKPLVTLAVLDEPSDLKSYKSRDPFKPLVPIGTSDTSGGAAGIPAPSTGAPGIPTAGEGGGSTGGDPPRRWRPNHAAQPEASV